MTESPLDRVARALGNVPTRREGKAPVYLDLPTRLAMAAAALSVITPEITEPASVTRRVLPARFVTDAMAGVPDVLPSDFA